MDLALNFLYCYNETPTDRSCSLLLWVGLAFFVLSTEKKEFSVDLVNQLFLNHHPR